jgi:hypothetical protein
MQLWTWNRISGSGVKRTVKHAPPTPCKRGNLIAAADKSSAAKLRDNPSSVARLGRGNASSMKHSIRKRRPEPRLPIIADLQKWTLEKMTGVPITIVADGRTPRRCSIRETLMTLVCDYEFETETLRIDRRRQRRITQQRPASVVEPSLSHVLRGTTRDISATGLQIAFTAGTMLHAGRILHVHVGRSAGNLCLPNRRQMMPGRVVWTCNDDATGETLCGIEFLTTLNACRDAA